MTNRSALVLYGSETGNAQDLAEEAGRTLQRIHFETRVCPLDAADLTAFNHYAVTIVITSTTGQGELPTNARLLFRSLLRKRLDSETLTQCQFSTFGLGDSSYPRFNWAVRKVHKRLLQLGAQLITRPGEADEQHESGSDGTFLPWLAQLRKDVLSRLPLPSDLQPIPEDEILPPSILLNRADGPGTPKSSTRSSLGLSVNLEQNHRLTPKDHWQDVRHLVFHTSEQINYRPGDVLTIYPKNHEDDVNDILNLMDWWSIANIRLQMHKTKSVGPAIEAFASPLTLRDLLTGHLDLRAVPRRSFFSAAAHFASDAFQKERLMEFTKSEFLDEYYDYATRPRRSILETLQEFDSVKIPWQWALSIFPPLRGRQFSIASGGPLKTDNVKGGTRFELLVAIVVYRTVIKRERQGVCTRYLATLPVRSRISVTLQKGSLVQREQDRDKPTVMIGSGTGLAPLRAMIWERHTQRLWNAECYTLLIFGCRNRGIDDFFSSEWDSLINACRNGDQAYPPDKRPLQILTAYSRDQEQKIYVQDKLRQDGARIYQLLHDLKGTLYLCGSSGNMPKAVRAALVDVFAQHGAHDADASSIMHEESSGLINATRERWANRAIDQLEREGRYQQETW